MSKFRSSITQATQAFREKMGRSRPTVVDDEYEVTFRQFEQLRTLSIEALDHFARIAQNQRAFGFMLRNLGVIMQNEGRMCHQLSHLGYLLPYAENAQYRATDPFASDIEADILMPLRIHVQEFNNVASSNQRRRRLQLEYDYNRQRVERLISKHRDPAEIQRYEAEMLRSQQELANYNQLAKHQMQALMNSHIAVFDSIIKNITFLLQRYANRLQSSFADIYPPPASPSFVMPPSTVTTIPGAAKTTVVSEWTRPYSTTTATVAGGVPVVTTPTTTTTTMPATALGAAPISGLPSATTTVGPRYMESTVVRAEDVPLGPAPVERTTTTTTTAQAGPATTTTTTGYERREVLVEQTSSEPATTTVATEGKPWPTELPESAMSKLSLSEDQKRLPPNYNYNYNYLDTKSTTNNVVQQQQQQQQETITATSSLMNP